MTVQRKRGQPVRIWTTHTVTDRRGNEVEVVNEAKSPLKVKGWVIPQRSSRAEVPGQQQINVVRLGTESNLANVTLWSRVEYDGKTWDVVAPPAYHHGTRHTRHWSIDLRQRP